MNLKHMTGPITKADAGGLEATITTPRVDSDMESVDPMGLTNRAEYLANPLVYWAHEWALTQGTAEPIGKATKLDVSRTKIDSSAVYAPTPKAQNVRALVLGGFVRKTSIGFDPLVMKTIDGVPTHTQWALREWSIVPMPANTDATITGVKSALRWFADQIAEPDEEHEATDIDTYKGMPVVTDLARLNWQMTPDALERLVKAAVEDQLNMTSDPEAPDYVMIREGRRLVATIRPRSRRVARFPQSS
ncbi:MAG: hypothetical protein Q8P61_06290 [Candidatus Nanopelagicales bacterium]|nr:hypothetical protein [Candidatus Nanopelagicales bacterium]